MEDGLLRVLRVPVDDGHPLAGRYIVVAAELAAACYLCQLHHIHIMSLLITLFVCWIAPLVARSILDERAAVARKQNIPRPVILLPLPSRSIPSKHSRQLVLERIVHLFVAQC